MRSRSGVRFIVTLSLLATLFTPASAAESVWLKAPKPKYPKAALNTFAEGSATVRIVVAADGKPQTVTIVKSSGNRVFDETARQGAMKWRMDPAKVRPSDMATGRNVIFDFKQEAALGAVYNDRRAYFSGNSAGIWIYAPFPNYPESARNMRRYGTVLLQMQIGAGGKVTNVAVAKSSGHADLDAAAVQAVRLWRARTESAGMRVRFPVRFAPGSR